MQYIKKTLEYLFVLGKGKRFLYLFLMSLPAGVCSSMLLPTRGFMGWIANFSTGNFNFWKMWNFDLSGKVFVVSLVICLLVLICCLAVMITVISRSMRIGTFRVRSVFGELNEGIFASSFGVFFYLIIFLVFKALSTLFLVLWQTVSAKLLAAFLSVFTIIALFVVAVLVASFATLYIPIMTFTGVKARFAFTTSLHKGSGSVKKLFLGAGIPVVILMLVACLVSLFQLKLLSFISDSIIYSLLITYLITFSMVSYFQVENIKREDYPKGFIPKD